MIGWGEYLGYIDVTYDASGKILAYNGAPIHLTNTTAQDPKLQAQIDAWRGPFEAFAAQVLGESSVELDQTKCRAQECLLGNFMADAMLEYRRNISTTADFALINSGGIRATIDEGPITRGEVLTSFPFGNQIVEISLKGEDLWKSIEGVYSEKSLYNERVVTSKIQVSTGINITYDSTRANGTRLVSLQIGDKPFSNSSTYNIVTLDFLAGGGDNIFQKKTDLATLDTQDQVLINYVQSQSPVNIALEGRIKDLNGTAFVPGNGTTTAPSGTKTGGAGSTSTTVPANAAVKNGAVGLSLVLAFVGATILL